MYILIWWDSFWSSLYMESEGEIEVKIRVVLPGGAHWQLINVIQRISACQEGRWIYTIRHLSEERTLGHLWPAPSVCPQEIMPFSTTLFSRPDGSLSVGNQHQYRLRSCSLSLSLSLSLSKAMRNFKGEVKSWPRQFNYHFN